MIFRGTESGVGRVGKGLRHASYAFGLASILVAAAVVALTYILLQHLPPY